MSLLIVTLWLYGTLPGIINGMLGGRQVLYTGFAAQTTAPAAAAIQSLLAYAVCVISVIVIFRYLDKITQRRPAVLAFVLAAILIPVALAGQWSSLSNPRSLALALVCIAIWFAGPPTSTFTLIAVLTIISAAVSAAIGFATSWGLMVGADQFAEKALLPIGTLAGAYNHSNLLGLSLAVGFPFLFFLRRPVVKYASFTLVTFCLLWSSSRSAIAATVFIVATILLCKASRGVRGPIISAYLVAIGILISLPLLNTDMTAYSGRGLIWASVLYNSSSNMLLGWGPNAFQPGSPIIDLIGYSSTHGHNLFITALGRHGWIGASLTLIALSVALFSASRLKFRHLPLGILPLTIIANGWLEGRFDFDGINELSYAAVVAIFAGCIPEIGSQGALRTDFNFRSKDYAFK